MTENNIKLWRNQNEVSKNMRRNQISGMIQDFKDGISLYLEKNMTVANIK